MVERSDPWGTTRPAAFPPDPILDSINEGVFTVDLEQRITSFNRAAERITGVPRDQAVGRRCSEVFRASICEHACALREAMQTGGSVPPRTIFIIDAAGERIPVRISAAVLREGRRVVGGVETFQDLRPIEALRKQLRDKHSFADIVGRSPAIVRLFDLLPQLAESDATVLIEGPSGTGKELFARALHDLSHRRSKPFVAVNCGALPDALLESELFGHKAGAFTDARRDRPGRFAAAHGGTLLLDEIGDVSPAMQVRLLRVLQERTFEPLGSNEPVRVDVRIIAATNKDLAALVRAGTFREDLYYRIHVVHLEIPPLRERREDIPLLVQHFVEQLNHLHGREMEGPSPEALALLLDYDYPGNVRELRNALEHAFALCPGGRIEPQHLPAAIRNPGAPAAGVAGLAGLPLDEVERRLIEDALRRHDGHRSRAARELGLDPSTLYRKLKRLGLQPPVRDGRRRHARPR
ncbi:MAG: sigma 54-interacting transcriptional regulator [Myxococcales bacterium]|nr:sigma 54-interacting transcriptional regulator [Myxococcales bacterium]